MTAGSRGSEIEIAGSRATASDAERPARTGSAAPASGRGRRPTTPDQRRRRGVDDRRDRDRPGRRRGSGRPPDDEQVARVAQRRERARGRRRAPGSRRTRPRRSRPRSARRRRARRAGRSGSPARGRSPKSSHATTPTMMTWRLPSTVARPAPTASMAWCQNCRSPAKKTPAMAGEPDRPRGSGPYAALLAPGRPAPSSGRPNSARKTVPVDGRHVRDQR